jgi:hypothetical protein
MILLEVAERRADPTLGRAGVRASRIELADHRGARPARCVKRSHQSGASGAYDQDIIPMIHESCAPSDVYEDQEDG